MSFFFAYFGPDAMMPLTSVVATVVGIFLMFGRAGLRIVSRVIQLPSRASRRRHPASRPHFRAKAGAGAEGGRS